MSKVDVFAPFRPKKRIPSNLCESCGGYRGTYDRRCDTCEVCRHKSAKFDWGKVITMTPDMLYEQGYEDGKAGKAMNAAQMTDPNYTMGYEDGKGDRVIKRPVEDEYKSFNDAPEGFEYTKAKRVPKPYEFYLSKGGSATYLTRERKNNQQRHILKCATCGKSDATSCWHHNIKGHR